MITNFNKFKHSLNEGKKSDKQYKKDVEAYKFFLVNISKKKVESGWEFKNDAKDALKDFDGDKNYKVVTEKELEKLDIKNPKAKWTSEKNVNNKSSNSVVENLNGEPEENLYHDIDWNEINILYQEWLATNLNTPNGGYINAFDFIKTEVLKYKMLN